MPFRALPDSDAKRLIALEACATKASTVPAAERPYPDELQARLDTLLPQLRQESRQTSDALTAQTTATTQATLAFKFLQTTVSHFIQVLNFGITREVFPAEARAHYGLDVSSGVVPPLGSQSEVSLWAHRLIAGETARLAATPGARPMDLPSAADLQAALDAYEKRSKVRSDAKDTHDSEQEDVAALRPAVDTLIRDLWDTIEFTHRKDSAPSRRRKCREWGLTYTTRPGEPPEPEEENPEPPTNPPAA